MAVVFDPGLVWYCSSLSTRFKTVSKSSIPETNLTIVEDERKLYDFDGVTFVTHFNLVNDKGEQIASICSGHNPYANDRGVVYIPKQGGV